MSDIGPPVLKWDGGDPVVVGGPVEGSDPERLYVWRFVAGSADQVDTISLTDSPSSGPHAVEAKPADEAPATAPAPQPETAPAPQPEPAPQPFVQPVSTASSATPPPVNPDAVGPGV